MAFLKTRTSCAALAFALAAVFATAEAATPVYAIRQNGDMLFYRHAGYRDGTARWSIQAKQIGNGWDFRQLLASR